jgi:hypothetical protein
VEPLSRPPHRARGGHEATYDCTVVTTQTEILAEGRPRTLGQTNSPFEIVREPKDAPFAERYLRVSGFPVYKLSLFCETCPPLFRHLAEALGPGRLSITEFKDRLASGLGSLDEDVLAVMSSVLPVGEYVPLLLRLWPGRVQQDNCTETWLSVRSGCDGWMRSARALGGISACLPGAG